MRYADSQRGAAVLLAMVTVVISAGIATSVLANLGRSLDGASGRDDQVQARLLARGAVDWARNVLADDRMRTAVDHLKEPWAVRVPPTPVGEAEVGGEIQDWSGRFNLNNLAPHGEPDVAAAAAFARLLEAVGVGSGEAQRLTARLLERLAYAADEAGGKPAGSGGRRTAPGARALVDVAELSAISGFTPELVARLAEFAAALPAPSRVNVNTAPAEVIFALTSGLGLDGARVLVAERERAWFRDLADFAARLPQGAQPADATRLDVQSRFFVVTGRARRGVAMVRMEVLLDRNETWPDIVWQRIL